MKVRQVAEELGVRYVLGGTVQIAGDTMRITVQLIDAISGYHEWAEHYDRNLNDIFELQDEITRKIITSLQIQLTEGEYARLVGRTTSNLKALEYFWRAEHYSLRGNKEDNDLARQWIEKAIELDPKFATAWALLGWIVHRGFKWGWGESSLQSVDRAEEYAQKAIALDSSNSKAYGLLSDIRLYQQDYDKAVEYGKKAVALSPSDPHWHVTLASKLMYFGNHEEAYPHIKTAMRLSPFPPAYFFDFLIMACFLTRRYDEGISAAKQLLDLCQKGEYPSYWVNFYLIPIYSELGQDELARSNVAELLRLNPNYRLENIARVLPFKNKFDLERFLSAFKKAGLK